MDDSKDTSYSYNDANEIVNQAGGGINSSTRPMSWPYNPGGENNLFIDKTSISMTLTDGKQHQIIVDNIFDQSQSNNYHPSSFNQQIILSSDVQQRESDYSNVDITATSFTNNNTSIDEYDYPTSNNNNEIGSKRGSNVVVKKARRHAWGNLSYAEIITKAIGSSPEQRLTLSQIYDWMIKNIPYFATKSCAGSSAGWKNSVRHNLSLHDRFVRIHIPAPNKCSYWTLSSLVDNNGIRSRKSTTSIKSSSSNNKIQSKKPRRSVDITKNCYSSTNNDDIDNLISSPHNNYSSTATTTHNNESTQGRSLAEPVNNLLTNVVNYNDNHYRYHNNVLICHSPSFINNNSMGYNDDETFSNQRPINNNNVTMKPNDVDRFYNKSTFGGDHQWNNNLQYLTQQQQPTYTLNPRFNNNPSYDVNTLHCTKNYRHAPNVPSNYIPNNHFYPSVNGVNSTNMRLLERSIQLNIPNMNDVENFLRTQQSSNGNIIPNESNFNDYNNPYINDNITQFNGDFHNRLPTTNNNDNYEYVKLPYTSSHNIGPNTSMISNNNNRINNYHGYSTYNDPYNRLYDYTNGQTHSNFVNDETISTSNNNTCTNNTDEIHLNDTYLMNLLNQCKYFGEDNTDNVSFKSINLQGVVIQQQQPLLEKNEHSNDILFQKNTADTQFCNNTNNMSSQDSINMNSQYIEQSPPQQHLSNNNHHRQKSENFENIK